MVPDVTCTAHHYSSIRRSTAVVTLLTNRKKNSLCSVLCKSRPLPDRRQKKKNKKLCVIKITRKETKQFFLYLPSSLLAYLHLETRPKDDTFAVRRRELLGNITIAQVPYVNTVEYEINDWVRRCFQTIHKRVQTCHEKKRKCTTMNK